jgi:acyl dehydratase
LLVAAPISTLAGHFLPGKRCVLLGVRLSFPQPVFPGDRLEYNATVTAISPAMRAIKVQVEVRNEQGSVVATGRYEAQVLPGPNEPKIQ